jgi:hypothetical protein
MRNHKTSKNRFVRRGPVSKLSQMTAACVFFCSVVSVASVRWMHMRRHILYLRRRGRGKDTVRYITLRRKPGMMKPSSSSPPPSFVCVCGCVCVCVCTCLTPSSNRGLQDGRVFVLIAFHISASSGPKGGVLFDPIVCGLQKLCV